MPKQKYKVWSPDQGIEEEDAEIVEDYYPEWAAKLKAEEWNRDDPVSVFDVFVDGECFEVKMEYEPVYNVYKG